MLKNLYTPVLLEALEKWDGSYGPPSKFARTSPLGIRIFKNPFIEHVLARAHPAVPGLWVVPVSTFCIWKAAQSSSNIFILLFFSLGILSWSLLEYVLHSFLFHYSSRPNSFDSKLRQFMLHGYHHEYPNDPTRLVAPPLMAWPLGILLGLIIWVILGTNIFWAYFPGIITGYLAYDWIHYYTHHGRPKNRIGKFLRDYHFIHHFSQQTKNMGISSPVWDIVFGLAVFPKKTPCPTTQHTQILVD